MTQPTQGGQRPLSEALALFDRYRDYVRHEDSNVHNRMTWFIQLNAFLIASFALITNGEMHAYAEKSVQGGDLVTTVAFSSAIQLVLALLGFMSATVAFSAVNAANRSIDKLRRQSEEVLAQEFASGLLPRLTGGGDLKNQKHGAALVWNAPFIVGIMWLLLAAIVVTAVSSLWWAPLLNLPLPHEWLKRFG